MKSRRDVPIATARPIPVEQPVIATTFPGSNLDANAIMSLFEYKASSMVDVGYKLKSKVGWIGLTRKNDMPD